MLRRSLTLRSSEVRTCSLRVATAVSRGLPSSDTLFSTTRTLECSADGTNARELLYTCTTHSQLRHPLTVTCAAKSTDAPLSSPEQGSTGAGSTNNKVSMSAREQI